MDTNVRSVVNSLLINMNEIQLIKWKGIALKDYPNSVCVWFETSVSVATKLHWYIEKPFTVEAIWNNNKLDFTATINTENQNFLKFTKESWLVRCDIILTNPLELTMLLDWDLYLNI